MAMSDLPLKRLPTACDQPSAGGGATPRKPADDRTSDGDPSWEAGVAAARFRKVPGAQPVVAGPEEHSRNPGSGQTGSFRTCRKLVSHRRR